LSSQDLFYSGTQRYTSSWFNNVATWEHLSIANIQAQRMALSGMSFAGSDIGGFAEQPTGELFARWIGLRFSILSVEFTPVVIVCDQEPWTFDENMSSL
jgi:alpha-glucosidase